MMEYLHKHGIVYRDLKPDNIICQEDGYLKMVDFGTAKFLSRQKDGLFQRTFTNVGTPHYCAPEMISGKGYTFSADYWSLGVFIYELMVGKVFGYLVFVFYIFYLYCPFKMIFRLIYFRLL